MDNDLISRSAATDALLKQPKLTPSVIRRVLIQVPAADAVEVVRCKNCKKCDGFPEKEILANEVGICRMVRLVVKPDDFCSYGERREDDGNL